MNRHDRREFLADVGRGMLVAGLGSAAAVDLGLVRSLADDGDGRLTFGKLEPLVSLMQETPPDGLLPELVRRLNDGTDLKSLVATAALANARAFGGQDYTGYHTFMALVPAYQMCAELPAERRALPVLKVLYRNSSRIHEQQVHRRDVLRPIAPATSTASDADAEGHRLRERVRAVDWEEAEACFAEAVDGDAERAFKQLQPTVRDDVNVHRVVLAWRAWAMLELSGRDHAHTMLRQSVRFCLDSEPKLRSRDELPAVRELLPRLLDQYGLVGRAPGDRAAEDGWVERLARLIFSGTREQAADATAAALAEGIRGEAVGEAISMAANLLVLHDPGRLEKYSSPEKPAGCVHGDSTGVHASDAANAWRNIARVSNPLNTTAALIVGAYHTAGQLEWVDETPFPYVQQLERVDSQDAAGLLGQAEEAIRGRDQARACAVVHRYGELKLPARPVFDLMLKYAVSEDGALHAEKYYRTVCEEFATTRPAFRWRQMVALARVTASEFGYPAPGYRESCELLGLS